MKTEITQSYLSACHTSYVGEMKTQIYLYRVKITVHNNPSRKGGFLKTLFKAKEFENAGFSCVRKHYKNGALQKQWRHDNHPTFPQTQIQNNQWLLRL